MKFLRISLLLTFLLGLSFIACESPSNNNEAADVKEEAKELTEEVGEAIEAEQKELKTQLEQMGETIDQKVEGLQVKLDKAGEDMKMTYQKQIENLKTQREKINDRLKQLGENTAEGWKDFKKSTAGVIDDIQQELDKISF